MEPVDFESVESIEYIGNNKYICKAKMKNVALLAYSAWVLHKNHKNKKKLNKLREINSDDFIKGFLNEFRKKCEISSLIIPAIALLGSSIVLHLIGIIIFIIVFSSGILF